LISVVRSTWRLRIFLYGIAIFTAVNATLAIMHYYGVIDIPSIRVTQERLIDPATGEPYLIPRLCATGIFGDPNDLSMITVARIELWSDGLTEMKTSPVFGIGFNSYSDHVGQVAHNSFVHTFVELGIVGGALFLGTFWFAAISFWKIRKRIQQEGKLTTSPA